MILLVTNARDLTTDYIVLELQRRALPFIRLNTERLPAALVRFGMASNDDWEIRLGDDHIQGRLITAAYFRRPGAPEVDPDVTDSGERGYCEAEWAALLKSLYLRLEGRWLNSPSVIGLAEDKPRQLVLAHQLGFATPQAVVTNDAAVLETFVSEGRSVAKPLREALLEGSEERVIFTSRVERATAREARAIASAPIILQREVLKHADIRVTVVGDRVFAARIHSQVDTESEVDWRRGNSAALRHEAFELPGDISELCVQMVRDLGLVYGAIDLIEDEHNAFWFLECNPNGQWAWIEQRTELPLADAIVDWLEVDRR